MTTHIFIVDETTFKIHLEYLFAGTGAKDFVVDFNNSSTTKLKQPQERILVGMIADGSRIRKNDLVLFYLQQSSSRHNNNGPIEGKFYGVFKAKHDCYFLDNNNENQYLKDDLKKSLTFRLLLEPDVVYSEGVTEWEALDNLEHISSPNQMLWSLIYRKLRGNRGNTMITLYESNRLIQLIRDKNKRIALNNAKGFTYDKDTNKIENIEFKNEYKGLIEKINLLPRLLEKKKKSNSYEILLQQYILQNISSSNIIGKNILNNPKKINWIGNEIGCGVGMQSIDIMIDYEDQTNQLKTAVVELKADGSNKYPNYIGYQMERYIDWMIQYYKPNRYTDIEPILLIPSTTNKKTKSYEQMLKTISHFNNKFKNYCQGIKVIEFDFDSEGYIYFNVLTY